ncbi:MAG: family 43 glycosylhydrolase [Lachnospiraceae bacterium]|nr:family 43 glycosylhydrolase [Lachnospiraceae bacterium]
MNPNLKQVTNPYLPFYEYIPDGEPYVFGDRVYIYGSHDRYNGDVYCELDYVCWSAPVNDLGNWRYEGVIYRKEQDPFNKDLQGNLYAPDVTVGPDGRYYLYYSLSKMSHVAVAVCDEPAGKYEFYGYVHDLEGTMLGARKGDEQQFDPAVITEGNLTYLYTGFCEAGNKGKHGAMVTVLGKDMITIAKGPEFIAPSEYYSKGTPYEGHAFFEAPSIRKIKDKYYFIYSSYVNHELCYAVSDEPDKPFEYGGVIISNCDLGIDTYKPADMPCVPYANNHGSIVEINGEWYIFYHRHTNAHNYSRQGCLERIRIEDDGSIRQVEVTSCGGKDPLKGSGVYPANLACNLFLEKDTLNEQKNVYDVTKDRYMLIPWIGWLSDDFPKIVQDHSDVTPDEYKAVARPEEIDRAGGLDKDIHPFITNIRDGAIIGFKYFELKDLKRIAIRTKGYGRGIIEIYAAPKDEPMNRKLIGSIPVSSTNAYIRSETDVNAGDGVYALYFIFRGESNLNFLDFELIV